mgnify:FL=1
MKKTVKKIWDIVSTVLVAAIVLVALLLAGTRLAGMHAYTVLSGSMEPAYHVGSLVFVKKADPSEVKAGDPITYLIAEKQVVTHRCVEVLPDEEDPSVLRFRTKGDANNVEDATLVHENNLIGKPVFSVPLLGFAANYIQHPPGTYVAIAIAALIVLLAFLPSEGKKTVDSGEKETVSQASDEAFPPEDSGENKK